LNLSPSLQARFPILDRLQDSFDPIPPADIRALERELGVTFPQDYVEFLLNFNAAYMQHPVAFRVLEPGPFVNVGSFDCSLGIVKEFPESETGVKETFEGRIPAGLVPIANSGSDPICMELSAVGHGRIYLWDFEAEGEPDNTYLVAHSFTEFLTALYPEDESYKYIEKLPVFQDVERGELAKVKEYLLDGGKVDCRNARGETLLMCAARTAWPKIVQLLLERGAQPSARDGADCTPVYHAAMGLSLDSLKLLLSAGADARYTDDCGRTLVELTEDRAYYRIARTLKKHLAAM
jgi:ankyrin repeat protein